MISLILASFIAVNTLSPKPPMLVREKVASMAANAVAATKQDGVIQTLGTNSFTMNGITVNIVSNTVLLRKFGAKTTLNEFSVSDQVQVLGKWTDSNKTAINARVVRNLSIQKRHGTFLGTVISTASANFVFKPAARPQMTVTLKKNSSVTVGQKLLVKGLWDTQLNTLTEAVIIRLLPLPGKIKPPQPQSESGQ